MPGLIWVSTAVLVGCSLAAHWALRSVRADNRGGLRWAVSLTLVLGVVFLASQGLVWLRLTEHQAGIRSSLYAYTFYMLSGLHALHVIGGVILQAVVTVLTFRGHYWSLNADALRFTAWYWHFLDGAWLTLLATLLLT
ncbi:MAG: heme-copper oxidase subunit III [Planctomycetota bacterium]